MSSYSHLQRRPQTKREWVEIRDGWQRLSSEAGDAKRRANVNGTGSEVQPYINKMHEIDGEMEAWYSQYDSMYNSLPE